MEGEIGVLVGRLHRADYPSITRYQALSSRKLECVRYLLLTFLNTTAQPHGAASEFLVL